MNTLTTAIDGTVAVVKITGRLTASGASQLRATVNDLISEDACRIVVDLSSTDFVDSSGLGALIGGLKNARVAGGDLRIAAVPDNVQAVLRLTNLDRVLRSHATVEEAYSDR